MGQISSQQAFKNYESIYREIVNDKLRLSPMLVLALLYRYREIEPKFRYSKTL